MKNQKFDIKQWKQALKEMYRNEFSFCTKTISLFVLNYMPIHLLNQ